jgi:ADP-dependent NAD(P)H-hydrate dehydratase / NAD(P)H-hydrate epimerase
VFEAMTARWPRQPVSVLCGPGNNGGDGFVVARLLRRARWPVELHLHGQLAELKGDAALAAAGWEGPVLPLPDRLEPGRLVVDALFGTGIARLLPDTVSALLHGDGRAAGLKLIAVDVPSGMTGDGSLHFAPMLAAAPPADLTVTFHARKPAHLFPETARACGEIVVAPIGIPPMLVPPDAVTLNTPSGWLAHLPWPNGTSHKHNRGRLAVFSGPRHSTGAARLAARAGARIGAGWTALFATPQAADIIAAHETSLLIEVMREEAGSLPLSITRYQAAVFGPAAGLSKREAGLLERLCDLDLPLLLDADALGLLAELEGGPGQLRRRTPHTVLTPHDGEFARLFGPHLSAETSACRLSSTRAAAALSGCTVVRKGAVTVIAQPDGRAVLNDHASPWLATAGTGDVLSGLVGGLLAQGMDGFMAACAAVWMHGDAARRLGPGLLAEDLERAIPLVLEHLSQLSP